MAAGMLSTLLWSIGADAARISRDFSGDAMQLHSSRMMASPMDRIPALLGLSPWPFISYLPAPSLTIVNVQISLPAIVQASPPETSVSHISARPKFWTNRCGVFVEIEPSGSTNLMEEENKPC